MSTCALSEPVSIRTYLLGRLVGGLIILFMLLDGVNRLVPWSVVMEALDRMGYGSSETLARALGAITTPCLALTNFPPTSIVGAILWSGYLSEVVATHLRLI